MADAKSVVDESVEAATTWAGKSSSDFLAQREESDNTEVPKVSAGEVPGAVMKERASVQESDESDESDEEKKKSDESDESDESDDLKPDERHLKLDKIDEFWVQFYNLKNNLWGPRADESWVQFYNDEVKNEAKSLMMRQSVIVFGLESETDLNGKTGTIVALKNGDGRYTVEIGNESYTIKEANLTPESKKLTDYDTKKISEGVAWRILHRNWNEEKLEELFKFEGDWQKGLDVLLTEDSNKKILLFLNNNNNLNLFSNNTLANLKNNHEVLEFLAQVELAGLLQADYDNGALRVKEGSWVFNHGHRVSMWGKAIKKKVFTQREVHNIITGAIDKIKRHL